MSPERISESYEQFRFEATWPGGGRLEGLRGSCRAGQNREAEPDKGAAAPIRGGGNYNRIKRESPDEHDPSRGGDVEPRIPPDLCFRRPRGPGLRIVPDRQAHPPRPAPRERGQGMEPLVAFPRLPGRARRWPSLGDRVRPRHPSEAHP